MVAEAISEIERDGYAERAAIVVGREGWNPGIVGIVAGRLSDKYGRPAVVIGFDAGIGRGSVRGPKGARLHDALSSVSALLDRFGGHQAAAGLEVRHERLSELREAFERAVETTGASGSVDENRDLVRLVPDDDPFRVVTDIEQLEPCGHSNPAPRLLVEAEVQEAREVRGGHLKLALSLDNGQRVSGFGVAMGEMAATLRGPVSLIGSLGRDTYVGGSAVEIRVERIFA
jgi:single-stranded-DNA-specific exonuclease